MRTLAILLLLSASAVADAPTVHDIAQRVNRYYNNLSTFRADFVQTYRGPGVNRTERGVLWLRQPGRMRWDYTAPAEKIFLTDGKQAWFYVPGEAQARRTPLKSLDDLRTPLRYLLGHLNLEKELNGLSLAPDVPPAVAGNVVLRGVPKGMEDRVSEVLLEVKPDRGPIERLVLREIDGTTTEFRFTNLQADVPVPEAKFRFKPPPGVTVIEGKGSQ